MTHFRQPGTVFKRWPSAQDIAARLPISRDDAEWIWNACNVKNPVRRIIVLNDVANLMLTGFPLTPVVRHALLMLILHPPLYERKKER